MATLGLKRRVVVAALLCLGAGGAGVAVLAATWWSAASAGMRDYQTLVAAGYPTSFEMMWPPPRRSGINAAEVLASASRMPTDWIGTKGKVPDLADWQKWRARNGSWIKQAEVAASGDFFAPRPGGTAPGQLDHPEKREAKDIASFFCRDAVAAQKESDTERVHRRLSQAVRLAELVDQDGSWHGYNSSHSTYALVVKSVPILAIAPNLRGLPVVWTNPGLTPLGLLKFSAEPSEDIFSTFRTWPKLGSENSDQN